MMDSSLRYRYSWDGLGFSDVDQQQSPLQDCVQLPQASFPPPLLSPRHFSPISVELLLSESPETFFPAIKHEDSPKQLNATPFSFKTMEEPQQNQPTSAKKRRRLPLSCEQCRRRKVKCDRSDPCENCVRQKVQCKYADDPRTAHILHAVFNHRSKDKESSSSGSSQHGRSLSANQQQIQSYMAQQPHPSTIVDSPELIQNLTERIKRMEQELAEANGSGSRKNSIDTESPFSKPKRGTLKGVFSKTKYFGQSHWINAGHQLKDILGIIEIHQRQPNSEINLLLGKVKSASREIKLRDQVHVPVFGDLSSYVPTRDVADQLLQGYLRSFETIFKVLHIPTFLESYETYWMNPKGSEQTFVTKLLLIMAIGSVIQPLAIGTDTHESAAQWIFVAHSWLCTPFERQHLTVDGLQIHCLLLLARMASDVGADLVWLSAGSLLRKAMHMGLHIDPESHRTPPKSAQQIQVQRRLWATIVEIMLQSSIDSGGLPLLNPQDYDTKPPRNGCDILSSESIVPDNPVDQYTESSFQILLIKSQALRLEIAAFVNDFHVDNTTYAKTIELSEQLMLMLAENDMFLKSWEGHVTPPTMFQIKMMEVLTHRFLLAMHYPYAIKAKTDRSFYYSRKVGLETSLLLLSYVENPPSYWDDYARVRTLGGALFKAVPLLATMFIREELVDQLQNAKYLNMTVIVQSRRELRKAMQDYVQLTAARVRSGETNVKGHVMASALLAHIDALQSGEVNVEPVISTAVKNALQSSYEMLRGRLDRSPSANLQTPLDGNESGRGVDTPGTMSSWTNLEAIDEWFSSDFQPMDWIE